MRATRARIDRAPYRRHIREVLVRTPRLALLQQTISDLVSDGDAVRGVVTGLRLPIEAARVVMTVGTFLGGRTHVGDAGMVAMRSRSHRNDRLGVRS